MQRLEEELINMRREIEHEKRLRQADHEQEEARFLSRVQEIKTSLQSQVAKDTERDMRRYRERVDQDLEFREAQMTARYEQMLKQAEVDMETDKEAILQAKAEEYSAKLAAETKRLQDEAAARHAQTTQEIYEDVTRTLKDEQKRRLQQVKRDMEAAFEDKLRVIDNNYNGLHAKERQAKSRVEVKSAELEAQVAEVKA